MLEQILGHIHNWFQMGIYPGKYTIQGGGITLPFLKDGQYFRIMGSVFNDGLHKYGPDMELLADETFDGTVWALAIPRDVINAANERAKIREKITEITTSFAESGFTAESKADYSYQKDIALQISALEKLDAEIMKRLKRQYQKIREV